MDAALKAKWVEALRSGKYQQKFYNVGQGRELCCVGVGGKIAGLKPDGGGHVGSKECWQALGLDEKTAQILFTMNDGDRKTFPEIADYIEANL